MARRRKSKKAPEVKTASTEPERTPDEIVQILEGYRFEAENARKGGDNPRDDKWRANLDLYWNRFDFSQKAPWQSKAVLPEVPQFVDRFAAALTEALTASGDYYTVVDPADAEGDITRAIKRMMDVWLSCCSVAPNGHKMSFIRMFPSMMKLGAVMQMAASVGWHEQDGYGYPRIDLLDPRDVWVDHTGRNVYRRRQIAVDKHTIMKLARAKDGGGSNLYDIEAIERLAADVRAENIVDKQKLSGTGQEQTSNRKPIMLDEYLCDLLASDGTLIEENVLCVVANSKHLIRGPEKNPFWHGRDWVLTAPLVTVPLSPYGRSYMENFGSLAALFNDLTNLIMDAVFTSAMKAFVMVPDALTDPSQANTGIHPNKMFFANAGERPDQVISEIELGALGADVVQVWSALKKELQEAASLNEIGLGQFAPKGRTSAFEVGTAEQNSSEVVRDIARNVEAMVIEPLLDLVWKTGLQHMKPNDAQLAAACGSPEMYQMIYSRRKEFVTRPITFQSRGISTMIARGQKLRQLIQILGIVAQNPALLQVFLQKVDAGKLIDQIMALADIDIDKLQLTPREKAMQSIAAPPAALPGLGAGGGGQPGAPVNA